MDETRGTKKIRNSDKKCPKKNKSVRFGTNRVERSASGDNFDIDEGEDPIDVMEESRKRVKKSRVSMNELKSDVDWANNPNPSLWWSKKKFPPSSSRVKQMQQYKAVNNRGSNRACSMLSASNKVPEQVLDDALKDFERVRSMSSASNKVPEQVLDDALKDFEQDGGRKNHMKNKTKKTIIGKSNKTQHTKKNKIGKKLNHLFH